MSGYTIYGLFDPDSGACRYVGSTSNLEARLSTHRQSGVLKDHPGLSVREVAKADTVEQADEMETRITQDMQAVGEADLNIRVGGIHAIRSHKGGRTASLSLRLSERDKAELRHICEALDMSIPDWIALHLHEDGPRLAMMALSHQPPDVDVICRGKLMIVPDAPRK